MSLEVTINGETYRIGKLNALEQLKIAKRLAPLLAGAIPAWLSAAAEGDEPNASALIGVLTPIASAIAQLRDEDLDYLINHCLVAVERKQGNTWARVRHENGPTMFDDIDALTMLQLTKEVVQVNLGNFFPALGQLFNRPEAEPASSSTSPTTSTS